MALSCRARSLYCGLRARCTVLGHCSSKPRRSRSTPYLALPCHFNAHPDTILLPAFPARVSFWLQSFLFLSHPVRAGSCRLFSDASSFVTLPRRLRSLPLPCDSMQLLLRCEWFRNITSTNIYESLPMRVFALLLQRCARPCLVTAFPYPFFSIPHPITVLPCAALPQQFHASPHKSIAGRFFLISGRGSRWNITVYAYFLPGVTSPAGGAPLGKTVQRAVIQAGTDQIFRENGGGFLFALSDQPDNLEGDRGANRQCF